MILKLNLSPIRADNETEATLNGTVLTLNGTDYDLSELPDGATASHPELGLVSRLGDNYECTIKLTHGANAPESTRFPEPIVLTDFNGIIDLPVYDVVPEIVTEVEE